ncbi:MAG: Acetyl-coenzyme A synthetase [Rhodocyclaceae bacterium]|nr:MAG: acetoacetate--CoA ligase [Rhodocyclaceae bacterium]MBV6407066.1 Acetyl-coenzyme A synthetase [Rhodocyclaceae bacterium]MCC7270440.1 acetoacetate--CoA ligase [Rhodocyclaceae bacterium]CAG0928805.1 acetoacetyl-CoA synthetase [Rhodocyclaceae bacterium]
MNANKPLWKPSKQRIASANLTAFMRAAARRGGAEFADFDTLHRWSVTHPEQFWTTLWDFAGVVADKRGERVLVDANRMPGAQWFPDARLNFAENLLRSQDGTDALVFWGEDKVRHRVSHAELYRAVAQTAAALRAMGVKQGDRVAAYMPNHPATVVAMLAAASVGAVFSSASPDFGVQGVLDRFGQIEPKVLFACDGYYYNGKAIDCLGKVSEIAARMPSIERVVIVPYAGGRAAEARHGTTLAEFLAPFAGETAIRFAQLPFDHPLYILYSSGTTGVPKCIVHSTGGTLLQHLKEHKLHGDVKPGDRLFYFTTCGWMMWNWLVSGLASGAALLLYDGSPFVGRGNILFDFAEAEGMTHFGTSAKFIDAIAKINLAPMKTHDLGALRTVFSTGSPLVPEAFEYVYASIKRDVQLASISGGTDIISCFVLGNPLGPVRRGEIQCRGLGMAVEVFDEAGRPVHQAKGELVCIKPFPSMPAGFWNDPDGKKYRAAYFDRFDNIWCHGDFIEETAHGGFVIYGRSDATLNPGGVRIGTAEIYRQVEKLDEVLESLVIGQDWEKDTRVVLFVKLREGRVLDDALAKRIKEVIRENTTPRHVPAKILQVGDIPRTKSNKIVELAVRNVVHGEPVKNVEALANPEALDWFRNRIELQT